MYAVASTASPHLLTLPVFRPLLFDEVGKPIVSFDEREAFANSSQEWDGLLSQIYIKYQPNNQEDPSGLSHTKQPSGNGLKQAESTIWIHADYLS